MANLNESESSPTNLGPSSEESQLRLSTTTERTEELAATSKVNTYRPNMPDYGAYYAWPQNDDEWVHPEDRDLALKLLPSSRVFKRNYWDGEYYHLEYGKAKLRVQPSLWTAVPQIDLSVGQRVELLSHYGQNDPGIFRIREVLFNRKTGAYEFLLGKGDMQMTRAFARTDLRALDVKVELRTGFFEHAVPKWEPSTTATESIDVGELFG